MSVARIRASAGVPTRQAKCLRHLADGSLRGACFSRLPVHILPVGFALNHTNRLIHRWIPDLLHQTAGPAYLERIDARCLPESEVLLQGKAPEAGSMRHFPHLHAQAAPQ